MRLMMARDLSGAEKRFSVYDGSGRLLYRVTGAYTNAGSDLKLWDETGREVAAAIQRGPVKSVYTILIDGIPTLKLFRRIHYIYPCCRLFGLGWRIRGNLLGQEYQVIDSRGGVVFKQTRAWAQRGECFELRVSNPNCQTICLGIAMVLNDVIPTGTNPVFVKE